MNKILNKIILLKDKTVYVLDEDSMYYEIIDFVKALRASDLNDLPLLVKGNVEVEDYR